MPIEMELKMIIKICENKQHLPNLKGDFIVLINFSHLFGNEAF